jgi:hypothetical protein
MTIPQQKRDHRRHKDHVLVMRFGKRVAEVKVDQYETGQHPTAGANHQDTPQ